jgi:hypothetical protein
MIAWAVTLAAGCVALVLVALLMGRGIFDLWQRTGLSCAAGGLIAAGVPRLLGDPPGAFDLLFLGGLLVFFARTYGGHLMARLDALDGAADGRQRLSRVRKPAWWPLRWPSWGPAAAHRSDSEETSR